MVSLFEFSQAAATSIYLFMFRLRNDLGWNAGARSIVMELGDCTTTFKPSPDCVGVVVGLSTSDNGPMITDIQHGFYFRRDSVGQVFTVIERGTSKTVPATYSIDDQFHVNRLSGVVTYWKNDTVVYTSDTPSIGPVFLDASLYSTGDRVL